MSNFGNFGSGGNIPQTPYNEENNDQVVVLAEDLGSLFEGTGPFQPDGFHAYPPSKFMAKK